MGVTSTGSISLEQLRSRVAVLEGDFFKVRVADTLKGVGWAKTLDGFKESVDPYGKPWAPVGRDGGLRRGQYGPRRAGKPLVDTGQLRRSVSASSRSSAFEIALGADYARYHQYGTSKIKQRQMVPMEETGGLGDIWTEAFNDATEKMVDKALKGQ